MAASKAATTSACVRNLSSFHSITGRTVCHSSALLAFSTGNPRSRPARMMAPSAQNRRAYRDPTGTGMSSQVKAKARLHQCRSSEISLRARTSTATAASTPSARLLYSITSSARINIRRARPTRGRLPVSPRPRSPLLPPRIGRPPSEGAALTSKPFLHDIGRRCPQCLPLSKGHRHPAEKTRLCSDAGAKPQRSARSAAVR